MRRVLLATALLVALAACTSPDPARPGKAPPGSAAKAPGSAPPGSVPPAATRPAAIQSAVPAAHCPSMPVSLDETQGTGHGATLWALFFGPLRRDTEIKVVWRMTGDGDLSMWANGPRGARVTPVWGPEAHGGSTWQKPGQEWGTGWVFPSAGCWMVHATRSQSGSGELALLIR
jgi:hypothetical protein